MKKLIVIVLLFIFVLFIFIYFFKGGIILDHLGIHLEEIHTSDNYSTIDANHNGIPDALDIVEAARKEVRQQTIYKSRYYQGGYPPSDEGVCTDVIWRGLLGANITLKDLMDADIAEHTHLYPRVDGKPDPNIDFRRVPNQFVYFERYAESLTTELITGDNDNLQQWQAGDIVVFMERNFHHVGIISDKKAKDGTPYFLHNIRPFAAEVKLSSFKTPIAGHYRWKY